MGQEIYFEQNKNLSDLSKVENIINSLGEIRKEIFSSDDLGKLDSIDRCLASLMEEIKLKELKIWGHKQSPNLFKLAKKLGVSTTLGLIESKGFLDHTSKMILENGNEVFISQPYNLFLEDVKELVKLCEENNLALKIDGNSSYFPGRTLRIILSKIKEVKEE